MPINAIHRDGTPFHGTEVNEDAKAKLRVIQRAVYELKASAFLKSADVQADPGSPNAQIILEFPSVITFSGERKGLLPSILNLADNYTIIKTDGGIYVTVTVLNYWKEG